MRGQHHIEGARGASKPSSAMRKGQSPALLTRIEPDRASISFTTRMIPSASNTERPAAPRRPGLDFRNHRVDALLPEIEHRPFAPSAANSAVAAHAAPPRAALPAIDG